VVDERGDVSVSHDEPPCATGCGRRVRPTLVVTELRQLSREGD
jgi:hypothetical protein